MMGNQNENEETLTIRPYARLITMLGDQLIKDEKVALSEIIKNSYDADASRVIVSFIGFNDDFSKTEDSKIVIEDNGCGMGRETLENAWLNPASTGKLKHKKTEPLTQKGRFIQGEKGIGRFAVFKLGSVVTITTRPQKKDAAGKFVDEGEASEFTMSYDFSRYDSDFLTEAGVDKTLYLDQLRVSLGEKDPSFFSGTSYGMQYHHGTRIEISHLKTPWSEDKVKQINQTIGKMLPVLLSNNSESADFSVLFYFGPRLILTQSPNETIADLVSTDKPALKITDGLFDSKANKYVFLLDGQKKELSFDDIKKSGIKTFDSFFPNGQASNVRCGDFIFEFYFFDFGPGLTVDSKHYLDKIEKNTIKDHRIYLYRDKVRVMPYGDPDDDWLGIDISRGTERANAFVSNNQTVGCVYISSSDNPDLRDKTNREGLIDDGSAYGDFIHVIQLFLRWVAAYPYMDYVQTKKTAVVSDRLSELFTMRVIKHAIKEIEKGANPKPELEKIQKNYQTDLDAFNSHMEITERLAGVGMSAETTLHDIRIFVFDAKQEVESIIDGWDKNHVFDRNDVIKRLSSVEEYLSLAFDQITKVGVLFPSTQSTREKNEVFPIIDEIRGIYQHSMTKESISCSIEGKDSHLEAFVVEAILMQVFVNLFDNSVYWLAHSQAANKKILISLNNDAKKVVFSDNGPGISHEDEKRIFRPFFTRKGEDGHGLGLYIAKQLLERSGFSIKLITEQSEKLLPGANFLIILSERGNKHGEDEPR